MDAFFSTNLSVPLIQIALLLLMSSLALVFGSVKLALILNYGFILYWSYILNMDVVREAGQTVVDKFTFLFFGFGLVIVLLVLVGFAAHSD